MICNFVFGYFTFLADKRQAHRETWGAQSAAAIMHLQLPFGSLFVLSRGQRGSLPCSLISHASNSKKLMALPTFVVCSNICSAKWHNIKSGCASKYALWQDASTHRYTCVLIRSQRSPFFQHAKSAKEKLSMIWNFVLGCLGFQSDKSQAHSDTWIAKSAAAIMHLHLPLVSLLVLSRRHTGALPCGLISHASIFF